MENYNIIIVIVIVIVIAIFFYCLRKRIKAKASATRAFSEQPRNQTVVVHLVQPWNQPVLAAKARNEPFALYAEEFKSLGGPSESRNRSAFTTSQPKIVSNVVPNVNNPVVQDPPERRV